MDRPPVQSVRRPPPHLTAYGSTNKYRPVKRSRASTATAIRPSLLVYFPCATEMPLTMTATVKAMDSQRWVCRTHLFQFIGTSFEDEAEADRAPRTRLRLLIRLRRPVGGFDTELLGVLRVQPLPAAELYGLGADEAADGSSAEKAIQNVETNMPPGSAHGDEAATDVGPQRQARAATQGFEFPPHIEATPVVLKHLGSVGSRHSCFGNVRRGRSHRGELHRGSNRAQAPIGVERRPLTQMRWISKRLPDSFRGVAQFSDENERPLLSVLSYLRPAGRTRCVLLAIGHLLLLSVNSVPVGSAESGCRRCPSASQWSSRSRRWAAS